MLDKLLSSIALAFQAPATPLTKEEFKARWEAADKKMIELRLGSEFLTKEDINQLREEVCSINF